MPIYKQNTFSKEAIEEAANVALQLSNQSEVPDITKVMQSGNLETVENGIRTLNDFADRCWLLSSVMLYTIIYSNNLYEQSGLTWTEYIKESKQRLHLEPYELSSRLSSARFFIAHNKLLVEQGWTPQGNAEKMRFAEKAAEVSGSIEETVEHLCTDSKRGFREWYKSKETIETREKAKPDNITLMKNHVLINGIPAVSVSSKINEDDAEDYNKYIQEIFRILKEGRYPVILEAKSREEAEKMKANT